MPDHERQGYSADGSKLLPHDNLVNGSVFPVYEDDRREVNTLGMAHAMRCFVANFVAADKPVETRATEPPRHRRTDADIVCDEEVLDAVRI